MLKTDGQDLVFTMRYIVRLILI